MAFLKCGIGGGGSQVATGTCNANTKVTTGFRPDYVFIYGQPSTNLRAIIVDDEVDSFVQRASLTSSGGSTFESGTFVGNKTAITRYSDGFMQNYVNGAHYVAVKE